MEVIASLRAALGAGAVLTGPAISDRYHGDWFMRMEPRTLPLAVVLPRSTEEVAAVLKLCHGARVPVVPQGGLTGLAGGAVPIDGCVLLSLERLRAVIDVDPIGATITVEAGVPLQAVQDAAAEAGMLFPLDIGARGSCQIGGNLSTNAGGNRVLRYGMARDLVLGLECVLADGTIVSSLNKMLKNNAGYDIKQLFIGSEGTLGVITQAVLRLAAQPLSSCTALCAVETFDKVYDLLRHARATLDGGLAAFEVMWPDFYRSVTKTNSRAPLGPDHEAYVLVELFGVDPERDAALFGSFLEGALEQDIVVDAVLASSIGEAQALWDIRDASGELMHRIAPVANFDVSIDIGQIGRFVDHCRGEMSARWPGSGVICFGHLADGNLHMFVTVPMTPFPEHEIEELIYRCVRDWRGSISAEHGIGLVKKAYLGHSRSAPELAVMRALKAALDPLNILNPGKIFD